MAYEIYTTGQLPASQAAIMSQALFQVQYPGISFPPAQAVSVKLTLANTSGSLTETIQIFLVQGTSGTARRIGYFVLAPNEQGKIDGIPLGQLDSIQAVTTDASTVDYVVGQSSELTFSAVCLDASGNLKTTGAPGSSGATTFTGDITLSTHNIVTDTSTGTKIGTGTTQKLGFFNATPIVQVANTVDYLAGLVNLGLRASGGTAAAAFPGSVTSSAPTGGGIGYATGAGGAVIQGTGRTTTVVLSKLSGSITLFSAAGSATPATFTVTNTTVAATDTIIVSQKSGTDAYSAVVSAVGTGSFALTITDLTGTTTEAPVFNFAVLKAVAA